MTSKHCNRCQTNVRYLLLDKNYLRATTASELHHFSFEDAFKCSYVNPAHQLLGDVTMHHHYNFGEMFKPNKVCNYTDRAVYMYFCISFASQV